uniref:Uncharacterized protein n=1 Tax=Paramormyrops kingsleyae TaxID=1676925 RepID=A0A3B3RBD4_9TELE
DSERDLGRKAVRCLADSVFFWGGGGSRVQIRKLWVRSLVSLPVVFASAVGLRSHSSDCQHAFQSLVSFRGSMVKDLGPAAP